MIKTRQQSLTLSILLVALLMAACAPASSGSTYGSARAWVDQPVTNALLPLASFTIRAHASRPGGGIVKMAFLVNSTEVGNAGTDASAAIVTAETDWTPSTSGVYSIQVQAFSADGVSLSEASTVCVSALTSQAVPGFLGDCNRLTADVPQSPTIGQPDILTPATSTPTPTATLTSSPTPSLTTVHVPSPTFTPSRSPIPLPVASPGAIAGRVFFDNNGNGIFDAGDEGKDSFSLSLYQNGGCSGSPYQGTSPDSGGNYSFSNLPAGNWCLSLLYSGSSVLPGNPQSVSVPSGITIPVNFAIQPPG